MVAIQVWAGDLSRNYQQRPNVSRLYMNGERPEYVLLIMWITITGFYLLGLFIYFQTKWGHLKIHTQRSNVV